MPILKDFRQTKKISIPSYADSEIIIYSGLLMTDADGALELQKNPSASKLLEVLPKFIKQWNFTGEDGKPLEITSENLNFMSEEDLTHIIEEIKQFSESLKKN